MIIKDLWDIEVGGMGRVLRPTPAPGQDAMLQRLMDIGFTEGALIKCVLRAPCGEPKAYLVRGSIIALRREAARLISIEGASL